MSQIKHEADAGPHAILFFGDSLTQKWDAALWRHYFSRRGALNAGVNGDRTEHLLWRIETGEFDRQQPQAIVVLIGTNDIGLNRPADLIAEGIRRILIQLRVRFPSARILLIGVLPRNQSPLSHRRQQVAEVNRRIIRCGDYRHVFYRDFANVLLDPDGRLSRAISFDGVHLTKHGYKLLSSSINNELNTILSIGGQRSALPITETSGTFLGDYRNHR